MTLILASTSRYRAELLARLRLPFAVQSPGVDETALPGESPRDLALRLSVAKAEAVAGRHPGSLVIGGDQVATVDGAAIGKPGTYENAFAQLRRLSGRTVLFHSALCVHDGQRHEVEDVVTRCVFRSLSDTEIDTYLRLEQPFDTAGSAKAESLGICLMDAVHSDDPTAIVGLPLIALARMLRGFGLNPLLDGAAP
jgi:septum formation protein